MEAVTVFAQLEGATLWSGYWCWLVVDKRLLLGINGRANLIHVLFNLMRIHI